MAKSPEEMLESMVQNLKENTGKTLEQWMKIAKATKLEKHGQIVSFLKEQHEVGHGYANLIAQKTLEPVGGAAGGDDLVESQYSGAKAGLKPIYEALRAAMGKFGGDVAFSPKKAYVSVRRGKQFAILQPSTATRLDVGINLKGKPTTARLEASGSFNAMVSHRVRVESSGEVNKELVGWLKEAYEGA